jgi:pimeloyl-ACP methyl ester carboxylesterase
LPDRRYVLHSLAAIPALLATRRGHAADIEPHVSGEPNMSRYEDVWYQSSDGLKLYARDYPNASARATVLCMHGLTRNSADFAELADALQANYRVIAVDQRGRGRSAWDPNPANYNPLVYVRDMYTLLDGLGLQQVIAIGTSMGGIMSMIMSALQPARFRAVVPDWIVSAAMSERFRPSRPGLRPKPVCGNSTRMPFRTGRRKTGRASRASSIRRTPMACRSWPTIRRLRKA